MPSQTLYANPIVFWSLLSVLCCLISPSFSFAFKSVAFQMINELKFINPRPSKQMILFSANAYRRIQRLQFKNAVRQPFSSQISALNSLEKAITTLPRTKAHQFIHHHLHTCLKHFKHYLQSEDSGLQTLAEMQAQIDRLHFQKQYLIGKHNEILQNIEMLCFEKDYKELQLKIDHYKANPLQASILTFFTHSLDGDSYTNTLNRSFVIQSSESSRNEFLASSRLHQIQLQCAHDQKEKIRETLQILSLSSERQTFESKQDVWLDIVYSKNAQEESLIFNSGNPKTQTSRPDLQFSEISLNEACQPPKYTQKACFSAKQVKSVLQLKQKSNRKKSLPKTSVKKELEGRKVHENVEFEDDRVLKKKLNFQQLSNQKPKKKGAKAVEPKQSKPIKKHMGIMG